MRQNLGQLNLGQTVLSCSFGRAHPFGAASSCLTMWQLLPAGGRRKGTSWPPDFLQLDGKTVPVLPRGHEFGALSQDM